MSNMLSSIVTAALTEAPDLIVVGQAGEGEDLSEKIRLTGADALIVEASGRDAVDGLVTLLRRFSALKVVTIDGASNSGSVHQLRPYSVRLPELSAAALQRVLRAPLATTRRVRR
jgi:hypothetical protein